VNWKVPVATDNCGPAPTILPDKGPGDLPFGTTVVKYTATDAAGNKATCEFDVIVENPTDPKIEGCPATITESSNQRGDSVSISWVEPVATVKCGQFTVEKSHEPGDKFPVGTTPVIYTVTDATGKSSTCTFDVVILDSDVMFTVSNVVTPDGDGINDVWIIPNIDDFKNNTVVVLDRWGNKIFQTNGYDNVTKVWNGTNNGSIVATGTYFYTIEVRDQGKVVQRKGFIEVIQ
jgi:gliding motility-associated-like protein